MQIGTSCAGRWPPQYAPAPADRSPLRGQFVVRGQELPTAYVRTKFEGRSFIHLRNIGTFRCGALIDPVTLTFDLLTLKSVWESHVTWGTPVQSFVFLGLLVFELEPMYATSDRQTDRCPPIRGGGITTVRMKKSMSNVMCSCRTGQCELQFPSARYLRLYNRKLLEETCAYGF